MRKVFKNLKYIFHSQNSNQINLNVMRQKFLHAIKKKKILLGIIYEHLGVVYLQLDFYDKILSTHYSYLRLAQTHPY